MYHLNYYIDIFKIINILNILTELMKLIIIINLKYIILLYKKYIKTFVKVVCFIILYFKTIND